MSQQFTTQRLVEFSDTDMAGIMHFAAFFRYMESVEHEFLRHLGFSVHSIVAGQTISFPRVAAQCDYRSPVKCEDILDAELVVRRTGRTTLTYSIPFRHAGRLVAEGQITCVAGLIFADAPPGPIAVPIDIVEQRQPYVVEG